MSLSIRQLVAFPIPFLGVDRVAAHNINIEGLFWFKNLMIPDPHFILPVLVGSLYLANLEVFSKHFNEDYWFIQYF